MSFPRYPEYKDSAVSWIGNVPVHWESWKLSHAFESIGSGTTPPSTEPQWYEGGSTPWVTTGELRENIVKETAKGVTDAALKQFTALRVHPAGSLVIAMYGATIGRLGVLGVDAATNQACCVLSKPKALTIAFAYYWLQGFKQIIIDLFSTGGGQPNISQDVVSSLRVPAPEIQEQKQITEFLDREIAKIDTLVAEQEQLITLLKEKRQAVISHAVTKGLDPSVPMKDSGVEWLGEVPAHWAVGKCGFYIRILSGFAFPSGGFSLDEANHRLLRGANVGVSRLKWDDTVFWERSEGDGLDEYEMSEGDLVIGMDRPLISEGMRVAKVTAEDLPSLLLQRVASLKVGPKLQADYLHHLLSSDMFIAHFLPETTGVSVPHISPDQINDFVIPVPPIDEQRAIVEQLGNLATSYSGLINEAVLSIELLRERRSALISAAVTGQIDVRGLAPAQAQAA